MSKKKLTFNNTEIKNRKFHYCKHPININNIDIDK